MSNGNVKVASQTAPNADPLLTKAETAAVCGCSTYTLDRWRKIAGEGPDFIAFGGGRIRYRLSVVEAWLNRRTFSSTAEHLSADSKRAAFVERASEIARAQGLGKRAKPGGKS
jgi:predicted DNA-binding transcriptional regulator AlpA